MLWAGLWAGVFCKVVDFSPSSTIAAVSVALVVAAHRGWVEHLRRQGASAAGELELPAVKRFRLIPAWPRYIYIAQLICIYSATGLYKTGSVWKRGDALYYALNMDHFYRFEVVTQWVSVYLGMNLFKLMSLVTLYWEKAFALVAVGLILRWRHLHRDAAWYKASQTWWRKLIGGTALVGAYLVAYRTIVLAYPWCLELQQDST
ncbi:MAG: hypothetical protein KDK70_43760, partial [Myxococcales bacterium]|nr:hypothetical protein [Myxococcales bacterium]